MEYPALKTFATLPSTFTLNTPPLDSLTPSTLILNTSPLVYQPNRNLLTLNDIYIYIYAYKRSKNILDIRAYYPNAR